jgi:nucleotide-binding universal stress UspA family protein
MVIACHKLGVNADSRLVRGSSPGKALVRKILSEINKIKPEMVIAGSHGHSAIYELFLGSVSTALLRKLQCPFLIIPSQSSVKSRRWRTHEP